MVKPFSHDPRWAKAKQVCRLSMEDIRMAKELGMSPQSLMQNYPSPSQSWKLPVKLWIRELHTKRFGRKAARLPDTTPPANPPAVETAFDENVPF